MSGKEEEELKADAGELNDDILIVKEITTIADGKHEGHITNMVREVRKGFDYIDLFIELHDSIKDDGTNHVIKTGFPASVSAISSFGRLLNGVGLDFEAGDQVDLKDVKKRLIGQNIVFQTFTEDSGFSNVMNKTIKFVDK